MSNLINHIGHKDQDNLIAGVFPRAHTTGAVLRSVTEATTYPRGTILAESSLDGKLVPLGTPPAAAVAANGENPAIPAEVLTPAYILKDTTQLEANADAVVVVYRTGNFNPAAVTVAEGYEITRADKDDLRKYGIVFTQML